jgi:hypothetical protein
VNVGRLFYKLFSLLLFNKIVKEGREKKLSLSTFNP